MKNSSVSLLLLLGVWVSISGCSVKATSVGDKQETVQALDGVKFISKDAKRGDDSRSFAQQSYTISTDGRLLLRFESLGASVSSIDTTKPIRIRVTPINAAEHDKAIASLVVCPITQDWMMAATWKSAHPFGGGSWQDGGAINLDECVAAPSGTNSLKPKLNNSFTTASPDPCTETNAVCYDVSAWYRSYVVERHVNFGVAVIAKDAQSISVYGDGSGSKGPRIQWTDLYAIVVPSPASL
jgi:hypothetical protein